MSDPASPTSDIRITSIAQLTRNGSWRLTGLHDRNEDLLLWVTKGQGLATLQGIRRGVGAHNAFYIPAGTLFSMDLGRTGFGIAVRIPHDPSLALVDTPLLLRVRDVHAQSELTGLLDNLQRELDHAAPYLEEAARAHVALLSVWMRRQALAIYGTEEPATTAGQRLVEAFCALVAREFRTGKTMADFAAMLGVTPTHLSRACREHTGMTAADVLTKRSLYEARLLIETTELPLKEISETLGFGSPAYFSRFVLQHTGTSPTDLRKAAAKLRKG
ncbi:helix-turn-helix transcriptional regulator [Thalassobius vesicularis]|uniref:helix-turn-helix transcriptional regulator n=1 Tax=Thalassobius vesicularis TaxID=1294297 RepID=UPI001FE92D66|nr:helix-turn-helix transcriptional regulator [Thalassobius vesicularis]